MRPTGGGRRPALLLGTLGALTLLLAACSSTPAAHRSTTTTSTTSVPTTTSIPSRSTTSVTTARSTTTTTAAGPTTCTTTSLSATVGQGNGGAGTLEVPITFTNTGSTTCSLFGYPGMQLKNSAGTNIPTTVVRGGVTFGTPAANASPSRVTLGKGQQAQFTVHYSDVPVGNETSCPTSASALVTPPNDYSQLTVALQIGPCNNGTVHVSPVYSPS